MSEHTNIEWADATWNPITGCSVVSPGCTNCYAMKLAGTRLKHHPTRAGLTRDTKAGPVWTGEVRFNEKQLLEPLRWKQPKMIFVCAHGDLFHESVHEAWIDQVFAVMALCPQHTFQVLTKRPERMRDYLTTVMAGRGHVLSAASAIRNSLLGGLVAANSFGMIGSDDIAGMAPGSAPTRPLPNVWLGTSVEDQRRADERIPHLLATPAAVRFLSAEPLLGPLDLTKVCLVPQVPGSHRAGVHVNALAGRFFESGMPYYKRWNDDGTGAEGAGPSSIHWVIVGGESGPGARPMHPDWARSLRNQCAAAGVAFFFKQWGAWTPGVNINRTTGTVRSALWFNEQWDYGLENLARDDGHVDDEPDLYEVGKKAAGRLLDGVQHDGMPEVAR